MPVQSAIYFYGKGGNEIEGPNFPWVRQKYDQKTLQNIGEYKKESCPDFTKYFNGTNLAVSEAKKMTFFHEEEGPFLKSVRGLDEISGENLIQFARNRSQMLWAPYPHGENEFWRWFVNRTAAKFHMLDGQMKIVTTKAHKHLELPIIYCCFPDKEGMSPFEEVVKEVNKENKVFLSKVLENAKEIAADYQVMIDTYCQLTFQSKQINAILRSGIQLNFQGNLLYSQEHPLQNINMPASLAKWKERLDNWSVKAQQVLNLENQGQDLENVLNKLSEILDPRVHHMV